ncbi:uncharacterized protein LOC143214201 [Lasioglossum baleicum]|uniref:uncharacterized protein LOC143214201 n=1 Tax=Lasioglossum baleicum TaxID=434251 RepID=UPI003FCDA9A9
MFDDILNISEAPIFDNRITKIELHTYNPYVNTTFENSDEIRIPIQQQDLYTLPCKSFLYVEGKLSLPRKLELPTGSGGESSIDTATLENNAVAFMFEEIRYELNGVEIDRSRNPGATTTLKNYVSLSRTRSGALSNAGWLYGDGGQKEAATATAAIHFNFCVPMNILLGFCEDYKRVVINARHELILIRSRTDVNALYSPSNNAKPILNLYKIQWRMPHVALDEIHKLSMLRILDSDRSIGMSFRSWDLYEYPLLQTTTKHTWAIKTALQMEKPRYVIFALQTDRKNNLKKTATRFDHCALTNIRLYLNSETYPYDDLNIDFEKGKYALLYDMYAKFQESYYGNGEALLNTMDFLRYGPLVVFDCSRQNKALKNATVDARIEFEWRTDVPPSTTAYCLMIHDRIVEYNSLTNIVRKIT